jgi:two-component system, sensor histidine kinase
MKQSPRVLLVEDEALVRMAMRLMLQKLGCIIVGEAWSGEKAIDLALASKPDLTFLDISLSGKMDGIEIAQKISKQIETKVVFVSAYDHSEKIKQEYPFSNYIFFGKPIKEDELRNVIDRW